MKLYIMNLPPTHPYRTSGPGGELELGVAPYIDVHWQPGVSGRVFTANPAVQELLENMTDEDGETIWRIVELPSPPLPSDLDLDDLFGGV